MNRVVLISSLLGVLFLMTAFAFAEDPPVKELSLDHFNITTSNGTVTLYNGTFVGGNPTNFVTLNEAKYLQTIEGLRYYEVGTKINCDHDPGEPDPCSP